VAQQVGFAIPAAQQKDQRLFRQILHGILLRIGNDCIRLAGIPNESIGPDTSAWRHPPCTPVAETVAITANWYGRVSCQIVGIMMSEARE